MRSAKLHLALPGAVLSMTEAAENMEQMPRGSQHYNVQHSPKNHKHAYHIISLSASRAISTESFLAPFLHLSPRPTPLLVVQLFSHVEHHALHEQRGLCCEPRVPETSPTGNSENISNEVGRVTHVSSSLRHCSSKVTGTTIKKRAPVSEQRVPTPETFH